MKTDRHTLARCVQRALTSRASLAAATLVAAGVTVSLPVVLSATVAAAEIQVYSAGAVEPGLLELLPAWTRETGHVVRLTVAVPAVLRQRVEAGETPDVLIAPPPVVDALVQAGRVNPEGRVPVGRVGVAMAVRRGAPVPDISTTERFKQAVLDADSLVYNRASTGTYFERVLDRLGIADAVKAKTVRHADGSAVMEHLLRGTGREVGIGPVPEIRAYESKGIQLVGPLPAEIQNYTVYVAGIVAGARSPDVGAAFIRFITRPAAKATFTATGVE
jgi:molybdate transport system substrate-binding protein